MWRVIASEHRQAPGGPVRAFVRLQSMSGELVDHARGGGMPAHRCPDPLWKCTRCGPVCGMVHGRWHGYSHGGWRPCEDVDCIVLRGGTHDHPGCPCAPEDPGMDAPQECCDLYIASRPACLDCPATWAWPPVDPADIFVGEPAPSRPHIAEREDGIYVISGPASAEAVRLTDEELDELRVMLSRIPSRQR